MSGKLTLIFPFVCSSNQRKQGKRFTGNFEKDYQYNWSAQDVSNNELGIENQYSTIIARDGTTTITVKPSDSLAGYYIGAEAYWDKHFTSPAAGKRIDRYFYPTHGRPRRENSGKPEFRNVLFRIAPQPRFWGHNQIKEGERFLVHGDLAQWNHKDRVAFRMFGSAKPGHDFLLENGHDLRHASHSKFINNGFAEIKTISGRSLISIDGRAIQDSFHEGIEKLRFDFYKNSIYDARIGSHEINIINVPKPEKLEKIYSISSSKNLFEEGQKIRAVFETKNVSNGTRLWWSFWKGLDAADFSGDRINFTGSFVVDSSNKSAVEYNLKKDLLTEGDENISLSLYEDEAHSRKVASAQYMVKDTSLSPQGKSPRSRRIPFSSFLDKVQWPKRIEWKYSSHLILITAPTRILQVGMNINEIFLNWDAVSGGRVGYNNNINHHLDALWSRIEIKEFGPDSPYVVGQGGESGLET